MRIKKFTAPSLKEATSKMRHELGSDAIILNTRTIPKAGALGLFARETYEITAAIDDAPVSPARGDSSRRAATPFERYMEVSAPPAKNAQDELKDLTTRFEGRRPADRSGRAIPGQAAELAGMIELRNELESMRGAIRDISDQIKNTKAPEVSGALRDAYASLIENDVDAALAAQIISEVATGLGRDQRDDEEKIQDRLLSVIAGLVKSPSQVKSRRRKTRVIALVGPTGVGKTTTIAKLAAIHKLIHGKNVALLSADTYRIGAIEQLRTFAGIADIPMEVIYRPSEIAPALKRFRDKDIVFIDTVGRSHRSRKEVAELGRYVEAADADEVHLVLSASLSVRASLDIVKQFKPVKPNRLLFTKLDEAVALGPLLSVVTQHQLPVAYMTTGQNVPDDILSVEPRQFASMIYSGVPAHA
jgi:flagellar biosynthesis protein FlhF